MNKPHLILVIDDDPIFFQILENTLGEVPWRLHYESESVHAIPIVSELKPSVILMDLMMPKKDGIMLSQDIRSYPELRHIPIILLTALQDEKSLEKCLEAGADEFLSKNVSASELKARIRSMLRIRNHYDELQSSIQLREDLAHMVVHDLGNPLGTILLEVEDLQTAEERVPQKGALEKIRQNALRLKGMANDMLMLAKMEHGRLRLDSQLLDLIETTRDGVANLSTQAKRRKIEIVIESPKAPVLRSFDGNLILRVIENLLSNAIKFSPPSAKIELRIIPMGDQEHSKVRVEVVDQGPGVLVEHQEKIFQKFEVVRITAEQSAPQLGLGLAFCRMAVEAHSGKIGVRTNEPKGSVFWFEI